MKPLPLTPYEPAVWSTPKVQQDYLITDGKNKYSVPFDLIGEQVDIRLTKNTVEAYFHGSRVASHPRLKIAQREPVTQSEHMPQHHRKYLKIMRMNSVPGLKRLGQRQKKLWISSLLHGDDYAYEEYLSTPKSLTFERMQKLHAHILSEIRGDVDAQELYDELIETATSYADFRAKWLLMDKAKKMDIDSSRTTCHNSLIVKFNMLSRYLRMHGHQAVWRDVLGYEENHRYNRKTVGDFACYLVFINSINAR